MAKNEGKTKANRLRVRSRKWHRRTEDVISMTAANRIGKATHRQAPRVSPAPIHPHKKVLNFRRAARDKDSFLPPRDSAIPHIVRKCTRLFLRRDRKWSRTKSLAKKIYRSLKSHGLKVSGTRDFLTNTSSSVSLCWHIFFFTSWFQFLTLGPKMLFSLWFRWLLIQTTNFFNQSLIKQ